MEQATCKVWSTLTLGEIMRSPKSIDPRTLPNASFSLFSIPAFDEGAPEITTGAKIGSSKKVLEPGDVLLSKIVPHIRRSWVVIDQDIKMLGSSEWIIFKDPRVDPNYLRHFLLSDGFHSAFMSTVSGVGGSLNRARPSVVANIKIPIPPIEEQRRISSNLSNINQLIANNRACQSSVQKMKESLFISNFLKDGTNWGKIGDLITQTQYGTSEKSGQTGQFPVLRMGNVTNDGKIYMSDLKYMDLEDKELDKYTLRDGDILFNRTNSAELVGKTAVYRGLPHSVAYAGYLIRARTQGEENPDFISGYLNSQHGKAKLRMMAKSIVGMANINAKELRSIPIPSATPEKKKHYSSTIGKFNSLEDLLKKREQILAELYKSMSGSLFHGGD